jgi:hypothetical protein
MAERLQVNDAWTDSLDGVMAEARMRARTMLESERITEQIVGTRMDERLIIAVLEVARQLALLTERLSDLPSYEETSAGRESASP